MKLPKIAIIIGSTRQGRFADKPAAWLQALSSTRTDLSTETVDLRDYPLPFFDESAPPAAVAPSREAARLWAAKVAQFDGFIFLTAEYNHGPAAVLKNALDYAYKEFNRKPAAFLGYGAVGAARAVQSLRLSVAALQMMPLARAVHLGMTEFAGIRDGKSFDSYPHLAQLASAMLDDLAWWATALKVARDHA